MKSSGLSPLSMFLVVFLSISLVSATGFTLSIIDDLPSVVDANTAYNVKVNFENKNVTYPFVNLTLRGDDFTSGLGSNNIVNSGTDENFSLTITVPNSASGAYSTTLFVDVYNNTGGFVETVSVVFDATVSDADQTFCEYLNYNDEGFLKITEFDITNDGGDDDDKWGLLNEIEIDVAVENTHNNDDIDDVQVEIRILNEDGDDVTSDFDLDDDKIDLGDLKDDDEESVTFIIPEVPADIDEGDYDIYVAAYSEKDDTNCTSFGNDLDNFGNSEFFAEIEVEREYDSGIIVSDDSLSRMDVTCGDTVQVPLDLYNIGSDKEKRVLVNLYNNDLGIDEFVVLENFREGKRKSVDFIVDLPQQMDRSIYSLFIMTYWDWDSDEDDDDISSYDENSEDDLDETYDLRLDVLGDCSTGSSSGSGSGSGSRPIIAADLVSDTPMVDEEVVVRVTVTNPTNDAMDYVVSVDGHSAWAELLSVQPGIVNLAGGESKDVTLRFRPTESGVQTFTVRLANNDAQHTQDVSLSIEGDGSGFSFGGSSNLLYWVAVALVVLIIVLVVVIIIVAAARR